uniref:Uncharacterized protein n=1 Tax=Anguilla anguilla TaxID=7936 RepID=A0A0E9V1W4_ANGAN
MQKLIRKNQVEQIVW